MSKVETGEILLQNKELLDTSKILLKDKKIVDADELRELYGFSKSTQAKMRMKRAIPFIKIGGRYVRYEIEAIEAWLKSNKVEVAS